MELAPLPSPGFYSRLFVVWKTSGLWRPVSPQSLRGRFALPHGDHPVCSSVCPTGGLDGLHRPSGGVSSGSCSSGISSLPALCGSWPHLPVQSAVLRSVHGPAGLHSGYGSCVRYSSFLGYPYASLPETTGSSRPPHGSGLLRDLEVVLSLCRELGIVVDPEKSNFSQSQVVQYLGVVIDARTFMASPSPDRVSRLQVNRRRISALCRTSCQLVAVAAGDVVLSVTSGSRGPPADEVAPDLPSPLLGSVGCFGSCGVVSGLSSRPSVVASWGFASLAGCLSRQVSLDLDFWSDASDIGLRGSLGRQGCFRPLGPVGGSSSSQCQGVAGGVSADLLHFQPFLSGTTVAVFCDNVTAVAYLRKEGGTQVSCSQHHCAGDPPLGGISFRFSWLPSSFPGIRNVLADSLSRPHQLPSSELVSQHGRVSIFDVSVAGGGRPICHLRQTPLLHLFLALPRPSFRRGRTRSSSPGTVSWRTLFRRGPFFLSCWRSFGCPTRRSSP